MERPDQRRGRPLKPFFADTFAIFAYLEGDPSYVRRFRGSVFRTGFLNLYEAYCVQLNRGMAEGEAKNRLAPFVPRAKTATWDILQRASLFRHSMRASGKYCSYIDAAGYTQAQDLELPFLTGDPAFRDVKGVDFMQARAAGRTGRASHE